MKYRDSKVLEIYNILMEHSDEDHPITREQIMQLASDNDIDISDDIFELSIK